MLSLSNNENSVLLVYQLPNIRAMIATTTVSREEVLPKLEVKHRDLLFRILAMYVDLIVQYFKDKIHTERLLEPPRSIRVVPGVYITDYETAKRFEKLATNIFTKVPREMREKYLEFLNKAIDEYVRKYGNVYKDIIEKDIKPTIRHAILTYESVIEMLVRFGYATNYNVSIFETLLDQNNIYSIVQNILNDIIAITVKLDKLYYEIQNKKKAGIPEEEYKDLLNEYRTLFNKWFRLYISLIEVLCFLKSKVNNPLYAQIYQYVVSAIAFNYDYLYNDFKYFTDLLKSNKYPEAVMNDVIRAKNTCPYFDQIIEDILNQYKQYKGSK